MTEGLTRVALPLLEELAGLIASGRLGVPLSESALSAHGLASVWQPWMATLDRPGLEAVLRVVIAERKALKARSVELVWTGPEAKVSTARDTAVVVRELFGRAQRTVLVAGFSFTNGRSIFEPLHAAMRDRGVQARLFLHLDDLPGFEPEQSARQGVEQFLADNWPFGGPLPGIYYDPRTVARGSSINLHAKCVVVDERWVLIGSANFTHNAHARNIEVGVVFDDPLLATELARQWQGLVAGQLLRAYSPPTSA